MGEKEIGKNKSYVLFPKQRRADERIISLLLYHNYVPCLAEF